MYSEKASYKTAYDDARQNQQKTSPVILMHAIKNLLSQRSFYHKRFLMYTKIGKFHKRIINTEIISDY